MTHFRSLIAGNEIGHASIYHTIWGDGMHCVNNDAEV